MKIFKRTEGISTTDIVGRILLMYPRENTINLRKMSGEIGIEATKIKVEDKNELV